MHGSLGHRPESTEVMGLVLCLVQDWAATIQERDMAVHANNHLGDCGIFNHRVARQQRHDARPAMPAAALGGVSERRRVARSDKDFRRHACRQRQHIVEV